MKDDLERDALILANARRLIKKRASMPNAQLYSELFGKGSRTGIERCRSLGLDPDGNVTSYNTMCAHIKQATTKHDNKAGIAT